MREAGRKILAELLAQHRPAIVDAATDWVIAQSLDLRGQRPRQETQSLVDRVVDWNEALILREDDKPLDTFIQFVTSYRASSEFRISTLLRGFVSFRMAIPPWLLPPHLEPRMGFTILEIIDEAYFNAIFRMADEYVTKLNQTIVEKRQQLEVELEQLTAKRVSELDGAMRIIELQTEELHRVSLPIIRVWEGVLVLPLIGELSMDRAQQLIEKLLDAIVVQRAHMVILDITGLQTLDRGSAAALLRALQAAKLIGANGMIVGMSASTAQSLSALKTELGQVRAYANLADGLRVALRDLSWSVMRTNGAVARREGGR